MAPSLPRHCDRPPRGWVHPDPPNEPSPASTQDTPGTSDAADAIDRSSEQIDIGGRSLHLKCWGERVAGEPTVLLITGQGPTTSSWKLMARTFAAYGHHLCAYDRAGVGGSDPAPEASRTTEDQFTDLVALLDAADLQEPVVLAAHSLGSLPAVGLVARAPERVAGVVLIDPWSPRVSIAQRAALPPEKPDESPDVAEERRFLTDFLFDLAQNPEHLLVAASDDEVATLLDEPGPIFGDLPVVVLRAPPLPYLPGLPRRLPRGDAGGHHRRLTMSSPPSRCAAHSSKSKTRATTSRTTNRKSSWTPSATSWPDSPSISGPCLTLKKCQSAARAR